MESLDKLTRALITGQDDAEMGRKKRTKEDRLAYGWTDRWTGRLTE